MAAGTDGRLAERIGTRTGIEQRLNVGVGHHVGQAVATQQEDVAYLDAAGTGNDIDVGRLAATADTVGNEVGMFVTAHHRAERMVGGELLQLTVA